MYEIVLQFKLVDSLHGGLSESHFGYSGPLDGSIRNPAMVLVQILSDDKVWAHLLAANLRARDIRSRIGEVTKFESNDERLAVGNPVIVDLRIRTNAERTERIALIERIRDDWGTVIAIVDTGWLRIMRNRLLGVAVVGRHPDMRKLLPEILEIIFDRQAAQI